MSNQFENIKSTDPSEICKFGDVTSAHMNLTFLWCPLVFSFFFIALSMKSTASNWPAF
uniref:Transmembrane protein n=1 Tax=Medicago truncatula TaxID=3880 RepID=I3SIT9_MEDTR|nr:unknown [Medicago truncatula]